LLLLVAAIASAGLLALAKRLRSKEATAGPEDSSNQDRGRIAMGILFAGMGVMAIGIALNNALQATKPLTADSFMAVPAGLMFVFAGALLALPAGSTRWRGLLAALVMSCFAITLDWIAFGPGERKFSGGIGLGFVTIGSNPGELFGRAMFGLFAVILDLCAIAMWVGQFRRSPNASVNGDANRR
jgi:hypothetical protein